MSRGRDPVIEVISPLSEHILACYIIILQGRAQVMQIAGHGSHHAGKSIPPEGNSSRSTAHY